MRDSRKVVILGAGFAGIYAFQELHKKIHKDKLNLDITLISNKDHFLFVPLIHEVATGNLLPDAVKQPVRLLPSCCLDKFFVGVVSKIDFDRQRVYTERKNGIDEIETVESDYDYLIDALGSDVNYFGTPGAKENALKLKSLEDAKLIKNTIVENFEQVTGLTSTEKLGDALRIIIVGGGPTGVELAGELADLLTNELAQSFPSAIDHCEVLLIQRPDKLVPQVDQWFSDRVIEILDKKKIVNVMLGTSVLGVEKDGIKTDKGFIHSHTVIWTAGVKATEVDMIHKKEIEMDSRSGRIRVDNELKIKNYPEVYVTGDQAWVCDKESDQPYPMRAQFAVKEGILAADNIVSSISGGKPKEFHWKDQGFILSLGKGGALAEIKGMKFSGVIAWFIYRMIYATKLIGWRSRIRTIVDWTFNIFIPRDISKI